MVRRERALAKKDQAVGGMRSIGWEKEDLQQAETWSRTRRRVEEASAMGGHLVDAGREGRVRPVAERDSHSFETKWLERGMCERALVGALVSRSGRHRMAPLRIAYSMLRAVTPQTQLRELYEFATTPPVRRV